MEDFPFLHKGKHLGVRRGDELEPQEILLDQLARSQREDEQDIPEALEVPLSGIIFRLFLFGFGVMLFIFGGKALQLQLLSGGALKVQAQENAIKTIPLLSERGIIYDSAMQPLVRNISTFDYVCDKREMPQGLPERMILLKDIATILNLPIAELEKRFDETHDPETILKPDLTQDEVVLFQIKQATKACKVQENMAREYPYGSLLGHVLGYTAQVSAAELQSGEKYFVVEQTGKTGLEKTYERALRGTPGAIRMERDSSGAIVGEKERTEQQPGLNLVLWLNVELQKQLDSAMLKTLESTNTKKAAAIVLNPQTGGVLALVSYPSFDPNIFSGGVSNQDWQQLLSNPAKPLFNRAIGGFGYPTGSVIKPLVALQALQKGIIDENTSIFAPLEVCVRNRFSGQDECFRDWTFHGQSDVKRAIAESVNTFFYIIGGGYEGRQGLGADNIKAILETFGWGEKTGVDLFGEGQGVLPTINDQWRLGDTYHFAIGQGLFTVTPLQVASAFGALANGGKLLQPEMVRQVLDAQKHVVQEFSPRVVRENLADQKNITLIQDAMRQTVTAGSATGFLDTLPVQAAAKTGTAQTGRKTSSGGDYLYSWVVSFAPIEHPDFLIVVVVEDVREGNVAALPVAKDVMQWYFNRTSQ